MYIDPNYNAPLYRFPLRLFFSFFFFFNFIDMRVMRTNVEMRADARIVNESKLKRYNYIRIYII